MTKRERNAVAFAGYNIIKGRVAIEDHEVEKNNKLWSFFRKIYGFRHTDEMNTYVYELYEPSFHFGRNKIDMFHDFLTKIQTNQT